MPWKTIDCAECGTSVPHGRLSCPACGALLASVTGGRPTMAPETETGSVTGTSSEPIADPEPNPTHGSAATLEPEPLGPSEPVLQPAVWPSLVGSPPTLAARHAPRYLLDDPDDLATPAPPPSTYMPAGLMLSGAVAGGAGWTAPAAAVSAAPVPKPGATTLRSRVGPVEASRFVEIAGWFVVVGATMAVLGFLLPWSTVVIGARSFGSYFDTWGLASPTHVVVLATTMLVLALGILRTAVPVWIRSGVLPLALGSLLIGLVWPYQVGPLGADVGALVVGLGGLALVIGGVVTAWATRHVDVDPLV